MTKPGIDEKLSRPQLMAFRHQHAARKNAKRTFQHAHILIEHERTEARTLEKCYYRRDKDRVVCTNKFAHGHGPDAKG
jgi:hypothetical protein